MVYTKVHSARLGYLSPVALAFLLAVQATVRGAPKKDVKEIAGHLPTNQRAAFEKSLDELRGQRSFLLDRLAIPDPKTWPAARTTPVLVDLGIDEDDDASPDSEEYAEEEHDGGDRYVFRMVADASGRYRVLGLAVGSVLGGFLGLKAQLDSTGATLAIATIAGAIGWFGLQHVGRKRREDTCANCERSLAVEDDRCTTCRARVVAGVRSTTEKFELEEKIEDHGLERALREWDAPRR
jgi:hypothetical protein